MHWKPHWPSKVLAILGGGGVPILKKIIRAQNEFLSKIENGRTLWKGIRSSLIPKSLSFHDSVPLENSPKIAVLRLFIK